VDKGIAEYKAALEKNPNSLPAHMSLGMIFDFQRKFDQAKEHYQKALKINPKFPPAANNLAYLYAEKGENLDEALTLAQTAKEQVPDNANISDTLGWVYYKKGIYSRAVTYLQEATEKSPRNAALHYHLGMAYFKNGEIENGRKELKRALELDPKFNGADEAKATLQKMG
jgi:Flp pilus assembly protein TadD